MNNSFFNKISFLNTRFISLKDLNEASLPLYPEEFENFVNYRISINGLTLIQLLIQRQTDHLRNHAIESIENFDDQLADSFN